MKKFIAVLFLLMILGIGGYTFYASQQHTANSNKLQVAASFYPLYYFASEIGKEKANVFSVTPNGVEPHDYEPKPQDTVKIQQSKLLLLNGAGFEPWTEKLNSELTKKGVTIITTAEGMTLQKGEGHDHEEEAHTEEEAGHEEETLDPHIWLSPVLAKEQVDKITSGFIAVDPTNKSYYETNAQDLKKRLDTLNEAYKTGLTTCNTRNFVTSHAAFGYIANTYNLEQVSIAGLSPDEEPSATKLAEVATFVKDNNINYIFFETLVSDDFAQTIAKETGAKTLVLDPIEGIPDDEIQQGKNYFTVMESNLLNLQTALECNN